MVIQLSFHHWYKRCKEVRREQFFKFVFELDT